MKIFPVFNHTHLLIALICGLFMGCSTSGVYITVTRPAEINLKNFDKIAVGEIKGSGSGFLSTLSDVVTVMGGGVTKDSGRNKLSSELTQALFNSKRFEVLDYENLKLALSQNNLVMSSLTDGGKEEEVRKLFGNLALISGTISEYKYEEELTYKDVEKKDKKTGKVDTTRTYYRNGTAEVTVELRVVDSRSSKILLRREFSKSEDVTKSKKETEPDRIDRTPLLRACRARIIRDFMRMIVPYTERVHVSFETDKEMPELENGFNMVKLGDWDTAIGIFQKIIETYPTSPSVHKAYYNLGLSYMYTDQFDQARTAFEAAYRVKPETKYLNTIQKLNKRIEDKRRLEAQKQVNQDSGETNRVPMQDQGQPDVGKSQKDL